MNRFASGRISRVGDVESPEDSFQRGPTNGPGLFRDRVTVQRVSPRVYVTDLQAPTHRGAGPYQSADYSVQTCPHRLTRYPTDKFPFLHHGTDMLIGFKDTVRRRP